MESDAIVRQLVAEELDNDPSIKADGIGVAVKDGVVTLSGHVPSYPAQQAAVWAAQRIRGVKAVAQDLVVRLPHETKRHDDEIAARALAILDWSLHGRGNLTVTVDDGWVTLDGAVDWDHKRRAAEQAIRQLGGVTGISNRIVVRPVVDGGQIRQSIEGAFKRNAELDSSAISIVLEGSTVTLTGKVKGWTQKQTAREAAWSIAGVTEVHDNISIA